MIKKINPAERLEGTLRLPADKSISHRSVMFASLHDGRSVIEGFSGAADPASTIRCLRSLGVPIVRDGETVTVEGVGREGLQPPDSPLDCGNSGTTMRLLSGMVAGAGLEAVLTGDDSLRGRTMRRIVDPLARMGARIEARGGDFAPLRFRPHGGLRPLRFELPIPSAQLKSSVLLAGLFCDEETRIIETIPSRDHTERLLRLPVTFEGRENDSPENPSPGGGRRVIGSSRSVEIPRQSYTVPRDFSAAAFWLIAGAVHPEARIRMAGVGLNPTRTAALEVLGEMGADIRVENREKEAEPAGDLVVSSSTLAPFSIGPGRIPNLIDEIPILCVAALFADGTSELGGAGELRHKESDRLEAVASLMSQAGGSFEEREDGFLIHGDPEFRPSPATFESRHDHRIAMSAAVLALRSEAPSRVADAECTAISYPEFWEDLEKLTN